MKIWKIIAVVLVGVISLVAALRAIDIADARVRDWVTTQHSL